MTVLKRFKKEVNELSTYFSLSFLQVKLDNEGIVSDEYILKLITLDKILKLYFDTYVCCQYKKNPEVLLTEDEISYLTSKDDTGLVYIKKSITSKDLNTYDSKNDLHIYFLKDDNWKVQKKILEGLLSEVLK